MIAVSSGRDGSARQHKEGWTCHIQATPTQVRVLRCLQNWKPHSSRTLKKYILPGDRFWLACNAKQLLNATASSLLCLQTANVFKSSRWLLVDLELSVRRSNSSVGRHSSEKIRGLIFWRFSSKPFPPRSPPPTQTSLQGQMWHVRVNIRMPRLGSMLAPLTPI